MLVELGLVEQRYKAVLEVLDGAVSVTDVARRYGVGRQTVHTWLRRYATEGLPGLADRSSRPDSCPHQMAPQIEARVLEMRRLHPGWGPRTILSRLVRAGVTPLPSRSAVYRALVRHQLVDPKARRRRPSDYKRWERSRAMELWQMDVTLGVRLQDGTSPSIVTGIDDHSRYCVSAKVVERATARPVCDALLEAMRRHGVPEGILSDNGKVFTGRFGPHQGEVLFDRICREHGIRHLLTAPASPTTTGKVERFHKTLKREFLDGKVFASVAEAQTAIDAWVHDYNHSREHQSLGNRPPAERFATARPTRLDESLPVSTEPQSSTTPAPRLIRRVLVDGKVSLLNLKYHVGRYLAGQSVELVCHDGLVEVFHDAVLVATHARRHLPEQEARVRRQALAATPSRPATDHVVIRKVDHNGSVSFAGGDYRAGNAFKGRQVEVCLAGDTVQSGATGDSCAPTRPSMTAERSTVHSRIPVGGRTGPMPPSTIHPMSCRYRSHSVVRVPRLHNLKPIRDGGDGRDDAPETLRLVLSQSTSAAAPDGAQLRCGSTAAEASHPSHPIRCSPRH